MAPVMSLRDPERLCRVSIDDQAEAPVRVLLDDIVIEQYRYRQAQNARKSRQQSD